MSVMGRPRNASGTAGIHCLIGQTDAKGITVFAGGIGIRQQLDFIVNGNEKPELYVIVRQLLCQRTHVVEYRFTLRFGQKYITASTINRKSTAHIETFLTKLR